jgi:hypothetical protein
VNLFGWEGWDALAIRLIVLIFLLWRFPFDQWALHDNSSVMSSSGVTGLQLTIIGLFTLNKLQMGSKPWDLKR